MTGMASRHIVITLSVPSVLSVWTFTLCLEHISYIVCGRNTKIRVLMHLCVADCLVPCGVPVTLTSGLSYRKKKVPSITRMLFGIWIPNLVCGHILGGGVSHTTFGSFWPRPWPLPSILEKLCLKYISYNIVGWIPSWYVDAAWGHRVSHTVSGALWPLALILEKSCP